MPFPGGLHPHSLRTAPFHPQPRKGVEFFSPRCHVPECGERSHPPWKAPPRRLSPLAPTSRPTSCPQAPGLPKGLSAVPCVVPSAAFLCWGSCLCDQKLCRTWRFCVFLPAAACATFCLSQLSTECRHDFRNAQIESHMHKCNLHCMS